MLRPTKARTGATIMEFAIVAPMVFLLILGLIVGGMGVFRYQEVAHLAREASRYAATHGGQYTLDKMPTSTGVPAMASNTDLKNYLANKTVALDAHQLTSSISWSAPSSIVPKNMPTYLDTNPALVPPGQSVFRNYVTVTVTYAWMPEVYLIGPINLTSTSTVAMSY